MVNHPQSIKNIQPVRGPFTLWPRTSDAALALFAIVMTFVFSLTDPEQPLYGRSISDMPLPTYFLFIMAGSALYWRRHRPFYVLFIILVLSLTSMLLNYSIHPLFPLAIALYSLGRYEGIDRRSYMGVTCTMALVVYCSLASMLEKNEGVDGVDLFFSVLFPFGVWYIGRRIRIRGDYLRLLQDRTTQLEREQDREARRAVAEERARIAREMHDVVAHQVSLMTVQAGAAKTVAVDNPKDALQAMEAVEKAGRQALGELRDLIGILRPEPETAELDPQPGLADVPRLVERLNNAGLNVSLSLNDVSKNLPTRIGLAVYRIIQEALTNVLKHAGPGTRVDVRLNSDQQGIYIEVLDDGRGKTVLPGSGHGIAGMRERAQLLGGSLEAGPRADKGFRLVARLPITEDTL